MDQRLIKEKLESLRRCVGRVEEKRAGTHESLATDPDRQDIIALNLTRAIQICVDLGAHLLAGTDCAAPQSMAETFTRLADAQIISESLGKSMRAAVGFRNVAVHQYQAIDWAMVHQLTHEQLDDFRAFAAAVSRFTNLA
jgi:uncharacterized protein YutE (UPF0331/DUF86 family)